MKIRKISPPVFSQNLWEMIKREDEFTEGVIIGVMPDGEIEVATTFNENDDTTEILKRSLEMWESVPLEGD